MKAIIILIIGVGLGWIANMFLSPMLGSGHTGMEQAAEPAEKKPLYWVAPMDKNYRRDGPGKSPMGMDLVPVYEEDLAGGDENAVRITPAVMNNLGVKTAEVVEAPLVKHIETVGKVDFDESRIRHIYSRVEGWIERLNVAATGDPVRAGQVLYELYSPALVSAQEEYLAAIKSGNRALINASARRLEALGLNEVQIKSLAKANRVEQRVKVTAAADGIVEALNVRQGMFIKPATEVMSIATLESVWVKADVYESSAHQVFQGQSAEVSLWGLPDKRWSGMVNYIEPVVNEKSRTLPLRIRVVNDEQQLKPNMLARIDLEAPSSSPQLLVPRSAVIYGARHARVVKALGDGKFQSVLVELGDQGVVDGKPVVAVRSGLQRGDKVVTSAQFLIDSESNIEAELARMDAGSMGSMDHGSMDHGANGQVVHAMGVVDQVMPALGMVKLTHDPIPALDWPKMTMDFPLAEGLSINDFTPGETVQFMLWVGDNFEYRIESLMGGHEMDGHSMDHHDMADHAMDGHAMDGHAVDDQATMDHMMEGQSMDEHSMEHHHDMYHDHDMGAP